MPKDKKLKFEDALKRLEEIVALMEDEHTPLEEALRRYEEGIGLARFCAHTLDAAEKKIEILSKGADGKITAVPFSGADTAEAADERPAPLPKRRSPAPRAEERDGEEQFLL
jgi:exodeoxyribonuclease VII small subunit